VTVAKIKDMETTITTEVIIIGAGTTGLSLACQLIRYAVDFVIIDQKKTTTPHSKAIGVQARTLEIYEQINLANKLIEQGWITEKARFVVGGNVRGEVELSKIGERMSPYPFLLIVEQGRHEKVLYNFIKADGKDVSWETELEGFSQDETGVRAKLKTATGKTETIEAKFIVGCDGAKSPVRNMLGLTFEGSTFERMFYVADAEINWKFTHEALYVCLAKKALTAFFPMVGKNHYRIVGTFPEGHEKDEGKILYEEIEQQIKEDTELELDIVDVNWFATYKVHTRHVNKFSIGRCFVAGDAAHIHTPAGAQGMNTGIQDSYNLAWKIWLVLQEKASEKILETYNEERLRNAKTLLRTTALLFNLGASPNIFLSYFRTHIFPHIAGFALSFDTVKRFIFPRISQIGINYRTSSLSEINANFSVKAGDRMPYFTVEGKSIYDRLRQPKLHLVVFLETRGDFPALKTELESQYAESIDFNVIPLNPQIAEFFGSNSSFNVLLRPDNYIGFISTGTSLSNLRGYLNKFVRKRLIGNSV
jgi:2-polyprenyl-6-methoxyphenol hydroxylase-like FAD-dependent oxidoreductase